MSIGNQAFIRKIRSAMCTTQQEYFQRVFVNNENASIVRRDMSLADDFEETMLRALRAPAAKIPEVQNAN